MLTLVRGFSCLGFINLSYVANGCDRKDRIEDKDTGHLGLKF
jgi:hypothetical protein